MLKSGVLVDQGRGDTMAQSCDTQRFDIRKETIVREGADFATYAPNDMIAGKLPSCSNWLLIDQDPGSKHLSPHPQILNNTTTTKPYQ